MTTPTDVNLGPLTTTFSAPPAYNSLTVSVDGSSFAPYAYPRKFSSIANSCFPSDYPLGNEALSSIYAPFSYQDQLVYFSPGLCPSSWLTNTVGSTGLETTAFCCPPGFNPKTTPAVSGGASSTYCISTVDSTVITTVAYTDDGVIASPGFTSIFTFVGNNIPAGAVWIRYKEGDFPSTATGTSSSSTILASRTSSSQTTTPSSAATGSSNHTSSGLSNGAKIGIATGVPMLFILLASIFAFFMIRKRRRNREVESGEQEWNVAQYKDTTKERPTSGLPADGPLKINRWSERSELDSGGGESLGITSELPG